MFSKSSLDIFSGNATPVLASEVASILGQDLGKVEVSKFSDGEIRVELLENVRGHETFIIQSTCQPSNANIMELMLLADALKRSSASRITAIIPYLVTQDRIGELDQQEYQSAQKL